MSIKLMSAVWQLELNHTDKLVLLALADNANDDNGLCWPSLATLCRKTCLSERGVQGSVARLSILGFVRIVDRPGKANHYFIDVPDHPRTACTPPPHGVHPTPAPDAGVPPHGVHPEPSSITINEPPLNHQEGELFGSPPKKPSSKHKKNSPVKIELPSWLAESVWDHWLEHRQSLKKPLSEHAASLCLNQLSLFRSDGHDPAAIINNSIMNGWQGLFAPKNDTRRTNGYANGHAKPSYSDEIQTAMAKAMHNSQEATTDEIPQ